MSVGRLPGDKAVKCQGGGGGGGGSGDDDNDYSFNANYYYDNYRIDPVHTT